MCKEIIAIIKCASATATALAHWGITPPQAITIKPMCKTREIFERLSNYNLKVYSINDKISEILAGFECNSMDPFVFYSDNSDRSVHRLEKIFTAIRVGQVAGKNNARLAVIVIDDFLPVDREDEVFMIELSDFEMPSIDICELLPSDSQLNDVKDAISKLGSKPGTMEHYLKSAVCFLLPYFNGKDAMEHYEKMMSIVDEMVKADEERKDTTGIADIFIAKVYQHFAEHPVFKLCESPYELTDEEYKNRDSILFTDGTTLQFSNKQLDKIFERSKLPVGGTLLKRILADENILLKSYKGTYTSKVTINLDDGNSERISLLSFDVTHLTPAGSPNILNIIKEE